MYQIREAPLRIPAAMHAVAALMSIPELYWAINDRLSPQPEQLNWQEYLSRPDVATYVATAHNQAMGYVQFVRKTSIMAELTVAFLPPFRGNVARHLTLYAIADVFKTKGMLKIYATVPSDNRAALYAARFIGMKKEGQLTRAIVRDGGVRDLVVFGLTKEQLLAHGGVS